MHNELGDIGIELLTARRLALDGGLDDTEGFDLYNKHLGLAACLGRISINELTRSCSYVSSLTRYEIGKCVNSVLGLSPDFRYARANGLDASISSVSSYRQWLAAQMEDGDPIVPVLRNELTRDIEPLVVSQALRDLAQLSALPAKIGSHLDRGHES